MKPIITFENLTNILKSIYKCDKIEYCVIQYEEIDFTYISKIIGKVDNSNFENLIYSGFSSVSENNSMLIDNLFEYLKEKQENHVISFFKDEIHKDNIMYLAIEKTVDKLNKEYYPYQYPHEEYIIFQR